MIETRNLTVQVGEFVVREANLTIPQGSYGVLMGQTGSGKTTLLETICGLRRVTSGEIHLGGREVTHLKPAARGIGLVPQDGALFPTMSVADHLSFALRIRRWSAAEQLERVNELAALLHLENLLTRSPQHLSGGERQRVALGRALAFRPHVLCLDEPLSALDEKTRAEMIALLKRVQQEVGVTALHVTHNPQEAKALGDVQLTIVEGVLQELSTDDLDG